MTGVLKIRTTKEFGESTVSKILELVENSSSRKSRSENFISKFARYYTPAVCYGALALAVLPPDLSNPCDPSQSGNVETVDLPCPYLPCNQLPVCTGDQYSAQLLCRNRRCQQCRVSWSKAPTIWKPSSETKYVVFDKTGTLTKGVFEVSRCPSQPPWKQSKDPRVRSTCRKLFLTSDQSQPQNCLRQRDRSEPRDRCRGDQRQRCYSKSRRNSGCSRKC